jgi:hypothetical protein
MKRQMSQRLGPLQMPAENHDTPTHRTRDPGRMLADDTIPDDSLSAARGMLLGIALGAGFWSLIGGLVGIFFF